VDQPASRLDTALFATTSTFDAATGRGHDPEGLLSTLPAIASVLLGLRAGDWLRHGRSRPLLLAGMAMLALGALLACVQPMNKHLWTPSYALWTAGWPRWRCGWRIGWWTCPVGRRWAAASA
jgi:predicted acyltransferase